MFLDMSLEAMNWVGHGIALLGILLLSVPTFWLVKLSKKFEVHQAISLERINTVQLFENGTLRTAQSDEIKQLVTWFNQAIFIKKREHHEIHTKDNSNLDKWEILIKLEGGERIAILQRDIDFDIVRIKPTGKRIDYWAKNEHITKLLTKMSA